MSDVRSSAMDAPPDDKPLPPGFAAPAGSCDCHFHVFEHDARYPFSPLRAYTPAVASNAMFQALRRKLGLTRAVLVHPTVYGTDNQLLLDVLRQNPNYRGIAVIDASVSDHELHTLDTAGVKGIRITTVSGGGAVPLSKLETIAARIGGLGWHVQLFVSIAQVIELEPLLPRLPTPVVLDHFAGLKSAHVHSPEIDTVLRLLASGRVWVKLSGAYRASLGGAPYDDLLPLARRLVAAAPERLVWGTDWPHPNLKGAPMPNDGELLAAFGRWVPDETMRTQILVHNPTRLYEFPTE